jgi:integrase
MTIRKRRLKWVNVFRSKKTGGLYVYFRRPGQKAIPLPDSIGSAEFLAAYAAAIRGESAPQAAAETIARKDTVQAAIERYLDECGAFNRLGESTRQRQRSTLKKFSREHGDKPFALLDRKYLERAFDNAPTPIVARTLLLAIRNLMQWAVNERLVEVDPTLGIKIKLPATGGHHTWTEDEIAQFQARHPIGTKARLAFELLLEQGMRRSDVIRVGPTHLKDGEVAIKQKKTGTEVTLTLTPELAQAIAAYPTPGISTFLTTATGKPYSEREFNKWFRRHVIAAGLPEHCTPHGLRKAFARRCFEAGCTVPETARGTGHLTLREVQRYAEKYDRKRAGRAAIAKLVAARNGKGVDQTEAVG